MNREDPLKRLEQIAAETSANTPRSTTERIADHETSTPNASEDRPENTQEAQGRSPEDMIEIVRGLLDGVSLEMFESIKEPVLEMLRKIKDAKLNGLDLSRRAMPREGESWEKIKELGLHMTFQISDKMSKGVLADEAEWVQARNRLSRELEGVGIDYTEIDGTLTLHPTYASGGHRDYNLFDSRD